MQYLQGLPADVGAIPLLICATKEDLPGKQHATCVFPIMHSASVTLCSNHALVRRFIVLCSTCKACMCYLWYGYEAYASLQALTRVEYLPLLSGLAQGRAVRPACCFDPVTWENSSDADHDVWMQAKGAS